MKRKLTTIATGLCLLVLSFASVAEAAVTEENLSPRQAAIVPIAAFTAKGDIDGLKGAIAETLDAKALTVNEIKEIMVQLYAYTGFPRSLNALNTLLAVTDERAAKSIKDDIGPDASPLPTAKSSREYGEDVQVALTGRVPSGRLYDEFAPIIATYLKEHLFGDIFMRDVLNHQERELATISALACITGLQNQLRAHENYTMNVGITESQMHDFTAILGGKVGKLEGDNAAAVLQGVLESRKAAASNSKK